MYLPWEIFVLKPSRSWWGFYIGAGNAAECRLGAAGRRWDHDGPAVECPMSQCAMDQAQGGFLSGRQTCKGRGREDICSENGTISRLRPVKYSLARELLKIHQKQQQQKVLLGEPPHQQSEQCPCFLFFAPSSLGNIHNYVDSPPRCRPLEKPPCRLDQWRKNVGIGTRLAKEGEGECLRIFEISTAHLH